MQLASDCTGRVDAGTVFECHVLDRLVITPRILQTIATRPVLRPGGDDRDGPPVPRDGSRANRANRVERRGVDVSGTRESHRLELVGHNDLAGRGDGMQIMRQGDALYVGHMGPSGMATSVLDVGDPR